MKKLLTMLALVILTGMYGTPTQTWAITVTATGAILTVTYDEPTLNQNGSPLTDLSETSVQYRKTGETLFTECALTPATAVTGGGTITATCVVPMAPDTEIQVEVHAIATDDDGNDSVPSNPVVRNIDFLSPAQIN